MHYLGGKVNGNESRFGEEFASGSSSFCLENHVMLQKNLKCPFVFLLIIFLFHLLIWIIEVLYFENYISGGKSVAATLLFEGQVKSMKFVNLLTRIMEI